ncbi:unnamed protein product, partial [Allacma fusca]
RKDKHEEA